MSGNPLMGSLNRKLPAPRMLAGSSALGRLEWYSRWFEQLTTGEL